MVFLPGCDGRTRYKAGAASVSQGSSIIVAQGVVALGVSRHTVISIERGRFDPSLPLAFLTAQTFGCKIEDVFTAEGTPRHPLP